MFFFLSPSCSGPPFSPPVPGSQAYFLTLLAARKLIRNRPRYQGGVKPRSYFTTMTNRAAGYKYPSISSARPYLCTLVLSYTYFAGVGPLIDRKLVEFFLGGLHSAHPENKLRETSMTNRPNANQENSNANKRTALCGPQSFFALFLVCHIEFDDRRA